MNKHALIPLVLAITALSVDAQAQAVHSAAGALPSQENSQSSGGQTRSFAGLTKKTTPAPLPPANAANQGFTAPNAHASVPVQHQSPQRQASHHAAPPSAFAGGFDESMRTDVTIDVVDMAVKDLLEQLAPPGWRVRFQHVDESLLDKRVDLTATSSRGEVLYRLMTDAGLSLQPFDGFDQPLLLITSHR